MKTAIQQELVLKACIFAGAYGSRPDVCAMLFDRLANDCFCNNKVYSVMLSAWWSMLRDVFEQTGTLDELTVSASLEASDMLDEFEGRENIGKLYYAAANTGWQYLSALNSPVDAILQEAAQKAIGGAI